jgi:DNA-binding NarL/FixJ family response regulator
MAAAEALTPREQEVLQLLAEGLPNKTIADSLHISEHTVKFHVNAILSKLGAQSRTEAVVRATRLGLLLL